ncbi:MAG: hypothetical protein AABX93_03850 [Nanoarchaeota archaeon]
MKNEYQLKEVTPKEMQCGIGACPAIYEVERVTPSDMQCLGGLGCPEVYQDIENYLIIGTQIDPKEAGLEGKVGKKEALIKVPKRLIDDRQK